MPVINGALLSSMFQGFNVLYNKGLQSAPGLHRDLAMVVPSSGEKETYGWLGAVPGLREWIGDRVIHSIALQGYQITNRKFESTLGVPREKIEDDTYGIFGPLFEKMGADAAKHPNQLIFDLLAAGFATTCYDGQYFFDTDHPVGGVGDEAVASVSNTGGGSGTPWFLLDCGQAIKPMVFQERVPYTMTRLDREDDDNVFFRDEVLYGIRARCNAGYGLWQLAYASKQTLDSANYALARKAMQEMKADNGRPLNIQPTHLIVPPALEEAGLQLLNAATGASGASNVWHGTAKLVVSPHLA